MSAVSYQGPRNVSIEKVDDPRMRTGLTSPRESGRSPTRLTTGRRLQRANREANRLARLFRAVKKSIGVIVEDPHLRAGA